MTETLLSVPDQKEGMSLVYAKAMAIRAGYSISEPQPDRDSVDLRIQAGGPRRPALDLQLKATVDLGEPQAGLRAFRLSMKNYDDLRVITQTPRLLVVLDLPTDESQWMTVTTEELVLRRRALLVKSARRTRRGGWTADRHRSHPGTERLQCRRASDPNGTVAKGADLMKASIRDKDALLAVSPEALAAYARGRRVGSFRNGIEFILTSMRARICQRSSFRATKISGTTPA